MSRLASLFILLVAAILEAGGDAIIRSGIHNANSVKRLLLFILGGCVLFAYGCVVNAPPWDFGKLLGIYVVLFFVVAQAIAYFAFGQRPSTTILLGGTLIVAGGLVIAFAQK